MFKGEMPFEDETAELCRQILRLCDGKTALVVMSALGMATWEAGQGTGATTERIIEFFADGMRSMEKERAKRN